MKKIRLILPGDKYQDFNVNVFPRKGEDFTIGQDPYKVAHVRLALSDRGRFDLAYVWAEPREVDDEEPKGPELSVVQ